MFRSSAFQFWQSFVDDYSGSAVGHCNALDMGSYTDKNPGTLKLTYSLTFQVSRTYRTPFYCQ